MKYQYHTVKAIKIKYLLIFVILLFFQSFSYSQPVTQEWVRQFSRGNYTQAKRIGLDSVFNVYVLTKYYNDTTLGDFGLIKYNNFGELLWDTIYNSPGNLNDQPTAFVVNSSGDIYITGYSDNSFSGFNLTVKYNTNGVVQWVRTNYEGGFHDITLDGDGNVILVGGTGGDTGSAIILKYNSNGDTLWERVFPAPQNTNFLYDVAIDDSNNIYAVGTYNSLYYLVIKYNQNGNLQWYATYHESPQRFSGANYLDVDNNGNVYVIGSTSYPGIGFNNTLVKLNNVGAIQWTRTFVGLYGGQPGHSGYPAGVVVTNDGNSVYYTTFSQTTTITDFVTLKYNSAGDSQWAAIYPTGIYGGPQNDPVGIKVDNNNNIYIAGFAEYPGTGINYVTIKYSPSGVQQWVANYTEYEGHLTDFCLDTNLNVYVTGTTSIGTPNYKATTIKYSQPNGIIPISGNVPAKFNLSQNYPNPFNPITKIRFDIPTPLNPPFDKGGWTKSGGFLKLTIYDILGREVTTLVNQHLIPGTYEAEWDASNYPSGVYFYKLVAEDYTQTKKMVLVK